MSNRFPMDLSKFKKVSADDKTAVMRHNDGHEFKISLKALSPKLREQLTALPTALADGGEVSDEEKPPQTVSINIGAPAQAPAALINPNAGQGTMAPADGVTMGGPMSPASAAMAHLPYGVTADQVAQMAAQSAPPAAAPTPIAAPQAMDAPQIPPGAEQAAIAGIPKSAPPQSGAAMQAEGIRDEAAAAGLAGLDTARAIEQAIPVEQKLAQRVQAASNDFNKDWEAWKADYTNPEHKIDPNHYIGSMSTGQKLASAIGLILGGIGAGKSGDNPALKFINDQIDRDIRAQMSEQGKRETLFGAMMKKYGNERDAAEATSVLMTRMLGHQIEAIAQRSKDPAVAARGLQALGALKTQEDQRLASLAVRQAANSLMTGDGPQDLTQIPRVIAAIRQVDPKQAEELQDRFVPGMGVASTPEDSKVLKELGGQVNGAKGTINDLIKLTGKTGKSLSVDDRARADVLSQSLVGMLRLPFLGPGVIDKNERAILERIASNPTAVFSLDTASKTRLQTLAKVLDRNLTSAAAARGIKADPMSRLSPAERSYAQWAKAHPEDPASAVMLQKLGVE